MARPLTPGEIAVSFLAGLIAVRRGAETAHRSMKRLNPAAIRARG